MDRHLKPSLLKIFLPKKSFILTKVSQPVLFQFLQVITLEAVLRQMEDKVFCDSQH